MKKQKMYRNSLCTAAFAAGLLATFGAASDASAQSLHFAWPFQGCSNITSPFGPRGTQGYTHSGIDIACGTGYPITAAASGKVTKVSTGNVHCNYSSSAGTCPSCANSAGNNVTIDHGNGYSTKYLHLASIDLVQGQTVACGQQVGIVGNTGCSTGAHLHFEVRLNNVAYNPVNYVKSSDKCSCTCGSKVCGDDGCGGTCGTCKQGLECKNGGCVCNGKPISGGGEFQDILANSTEQKIAQKLKENNITAGCSSSPLLFCPNCDLTRWQAAVFIGRILKLPKGTTCDNPFSDVTTDTVSVEACSYISQLKSQNIITGTGNNKFDPNSPINRGAAAVMLANAIYNLNDYKNANQSFVDVPKGHWAFTAVEALVDNCVTLGCSVNTFCVDNKITRMEFGTLIARALKYVTVDNCTPPECSISEDPTCSGNKVKSCINGKYDYADCGSDKCNNGVCEAVKECSDSETPVCDGKRIKSCSNGTYIYETCPYECENNKCVECKSNFASDCVGEQVRSCSNGKFTYNTCSSNEVCDNGQCINNTECDSTLKSCNGNNIKSCQNGRIVNTPCGEKQICHDGECVDCLNGTEPFCYNNAIRSCNNYHFADQNCPDGQVCKNAKCITCDASEKPFCVGNAIRTCNDNSYVDTPCETGLICRAGVCVADDPDNPAICDINEKPTCDEDGSIKKCTSDGYVLFSCGTNKKCEDGVCISITPTTPDEPGKTDPDEPGKTDPDEPGKTDPDDPKAKTVVYSEDGCSIGNTTSSSSGLWLFLAGLGGLAFIRRRRIRQ